MDDKEAIKVLNKIILKIDKDFLYSDEDLEEIAAIQYAIRAIEENQVIKENINSLLNTVQGWRRKRKGMSKL